MRYDYQNHAWIDDDERYLNCGHPPDSPFCTCYGREHAGELAQVDAADDYEMLDCRAL